MKKFILIIFICLILIFLLPKIKQDENVNLDNNIEKKQIVSEKNKVENDLEGKTIAFIGDSLIEGYGNDYKGIDYYLKQKFSKTNFINNSKSGSTITNNTGTDNIVMINQAKTLTGNPDIIMFDGGANDIIGYSLGFLNNDLKKEIGNVNTSSSDLLNDNTVLSDFEEVIFELRQNFPNSKLCYLDMFCLDDETIMNLTNDNNLKSEIKLRYNNFHTEIKKMCQKWNITYLDLSQKFSGTGAKYRQDDWIHINEDGYNLLMPDIENCIKDIKIETEAKSYNVLVIGNSITIERDGIGMAASDEYHDYYYFVKQYLQEKHENLNMNRVSAIHWEENRIIKSRTDWINDNLKEDLVSNLDLVIFQLGDNSVPTESFETDLTELINHVKNYSPNAKIVLVGMWFINEERLNIMYEMAKSQGMKFVNISDFVIDENKSHIGQEIIGINGKKDKISTIEEAFHPNDNGMKKIADRIIEVLQGE